MESHKPNAQLVSPLFKPIRIQTTPDMSNARPGKSNWFMCCWSVIP